MATGNSYDTMLLNHFVRLKVTIVTLAVWHCRFNNQKSTIKQG